MHYLSFQVWLTLLTKLLTSFTYFPVNNAVSLFFIAEYTSMVCIYYQVVPIQGKQMKFWCLQDKRWQRVCSSFWECLLSMCEAPGLIPSTIHTQCGGTHLWSQHLRGGGRKIVPSYLVTLEPAWATSNPVSEIKTNINLVNLIMWFGLNLI